MKAQNKGDYSQGHSCCKHAAGVIPAVSNTTAKFFCPMCDGVVSNKPGTCPMCGMALEKNPVFRETIGVTYTCPMHPEVREQNPGACPICGMALERTVISSDKDDDAELRDMFRRLWIGAMLTMPVLALTMGRMIPGWREVLDTANHSRATWIEFLLSTPVVLWAGWPFIERGAKSLMTGRWNMFTLIALGTGAAYAESVAATLAPSVFPKSMRMDGDTVPVYFESAAVITVLVLLGQVLELKARAATGSAMKSLLGLAPTTARRILENGSEINVALTEVRAGDRLRVRPGEKVPVDGTVLEGASAVDEALITGEAVPVAKEAGSAVTGGTINGHGSIVMRAEKVGDETLLARIVQMVAKAQRSRAPIQRVADRVAGYFVPAVVLCAMATFVGWNWMGPEPRLAFALVNAVSVLIIACPCALGLATPMSIMIGVGRGAQLGILIRDAEALERLEKIDTVAIDKTGTLTEGKPSLTTVMAVSGYSDNEVLRLAASVETASEHPLAAAIIKGAEARGLKLGAVENFTAVSGSGVGGKVDSAWVMVGHFAKAELIPTELNARALELRQNGQTVFFVKIDDVVAGLLAVTDQIKSTTSKAIAALHGMGLKILMLTGDHGETAAQVAKKLNVDQIEAEATPQKKHEVILRLQNEGACVAMAGDGINDAPALAAADVGIAMGTGTDVAMESAGVTLIKGDLKGLVRAIQLSRATMGNIRLNLLFAFIYNGMGIPLAAGLLYPFAGILLSPMLASAAMALSSVSVIGNSLRLRSA